MSDSDDGIPETIARTPLQYRRKIILDAFHGREGSDGTPPIGIARALGVPYDEVVVELLACGREVPGQSDLDPSFQWCRHVEDLSEQTPEEVAERYLTNLLFVRAEFLRRGYEIEWSSRRVDYSTEFWRNVYPRPDDGCWPWQGDDYTGYGVNTGVDAPRAHHHSFHRHYGVPSFDLQILHTCDNRGCCNPDHLWLGTALDNMIDMSRKNRSSKQGGEKKYTPALVLRHRRKYWKEDDTTCEDLMEEGPVEAFQTVHDMLMGDTWSHLPKWPTARGVTSVPNPEIIDEMIFLYEREDPTLFDQPTSR